MRKERVPLHTTIAVMQSFSTLPTKQTGVSAAAAAARQRLAAAAFGSGEEEVHSVKGKSPEGTTEHILNASEHLRCATNAIKLLYIVVFLG